MSFRLFYILLIFATVKCGEGTPGPLRREAVPQIQAGRRCCML